MNLTLTYLVWCAIDLGALIAAFVIGYGLGSSHGFDRGRVDR